MIEATISLILVPIAVLIISVILTAYMIKDRKLTKEIKEFLCTHQR